MLSRLRHHGLRARLALVVVAAAVPLLVASAAGLAVDASEARSAAFDETGRLADGATTALDQTLEAARSALVAIAAQEELRDLEEDRCPETLTGLLAEFPSYTNLSSARADGEIWCSATPTPGAVSIADREYFGMVREGASFAVSGYQVGRIVGAPILVAAVPIRSEAGAFLGTVQASITVATLAATVGAVHLPEGAAVTVVDRHGVVVVRQPNDGDIVGEPLPESELRTALLADGPSYGGEVGPLVGIDGVDRYYALREVTDGERPLRIAVGFSAEVAGREAASRFGLGVLVLAIAVLIAILLVLLLARRLILDPVESLGAAASRIAAGDLAARTGQAGEDELGRLGAAFDRMADSVQERVEARTAALTAALEERDAAQARIRNYLDNAIDPLVVTRAVRDDQGAIVDFVPTFANEPAVQLLGPNVAEAGARITERAPNVASTLARMLRVTLVSGRTRVYHARYRHPRSGADLDLVVRMTVVGDGVAVALRDVTAEKQLQRALESARAEAERARAEAERANTSKTEFLSRMSHELRTPLNAVIGFAQILEMDGLRPDQAESVGHILRGGRHLLALINEILDISRIEAGTLTASPEAVDAEEAVAEAVELVRALARARGIEIEIRAEPAALHVLADRQRIKQILLNLLSNAVKFNRDGGRVQVTIGIVAGRGRISVRDDGPGIDPAMRDRVFAPFDRLGADESRIEGTGLGLTLSRALAERMDGRVDYDSVPGEGTTFWLELPLAVAPEVPAPPAPPSRAATGGPAGTILYIEDNLSNIQLVTRIFERRGAVRIVPAMLGGLGLELARERPDLVLLDLHLPDMSGEDLLARLRADPATREIPVVVMSADASPGVVERLIARGASAFVTKPISISDFLAVVEPLLPRQREPGEGPGDPGG